MYKHVLFPSGRVSQGNVDRSFAEEVCSLDHFQADSRPVGDQLAWIVDYAATESQWADRDSEMDCAIEEILEIVESMDFPGPPWFTGEF